GERSIMKRSIPCTAALCVFIATWPALSAVMKAGNNSQLPCGGAKRTSIHQTSITAACQLQPEILMRPASTLAFTTCALLACALSLARPPPGARGFCAEVFLRPGARLSHHDLKAMAKAAQPLLDDDTLPINTKRDWSNPESGDHGTVELMRRFEYDYEGTK